MAYNDEYPEIEEWEDYRGEHYPAQYGSNWRPMFVLPFLIRTPWGPVFYDATQPYRPAVYCYPSPCYPIYITHK